MNRSRHSRVRYAAGRIGGLALAGIAAAETGHLRSLSSDPEYRQLSHPLAGHGVRARSADGTELHAEVFGPEAGSTIVLIPGWTEQIRYFDPMTRALTAQGFRVVVYDLRGQGRSEIPESMDFRMARYGEDLQAVLTATTAGRSNVVVAGHSLGAMSIAAWAADHDVTGQVSGTVLMNTGLEGLIAASRLLPAVLPPALRNVVALRGFLGNPLPFPRISTAVSRAAIRYVAFGPRATTAQIVFYEQMLMSCPPAVRAGAGIAMSEMRLLDATARITVPTLVVAGALDRLTPPSHADLIAHSLPDLEGLVVLPRIGHMGPLECPDAITRAIVEFAGSVGAQKLALSA